jgi:hypothetical protein
VTGMATTGLAAVLTVQLAVQLAAVQLAAVQLAVQLAAHVFCPHPKRPALLPAHHRYACNQPVTSVTCLLWPTLGFRRRLLFQPGSCIACRIPSTGPHHLRPGLEGVWLFKRRVWVAI